MRALYQLKKQCPALKMDYWYTALSSYSPDWYESFDDYYRPPFTIRLVEAGSRIGYQWGCPANNSCEVNWLDPEPGRESSDYEEYITELQEVNDEVQFYRGFHQPPSEEEYRGLIEDYVESENRFSEDHNDDEYDEDDDQHVQGPSLRFEVGQRVACRIGPDPVNGWALGRISQLWYRERTWPANAWAAYKIELDDGRDIFAPIDVDEVIRVAS